jgi:hypothetical protein
VPLGTPELVIEVIAVFANVNFFEKDVIFPMLSTTDNITLPVESGTMVSIETLELIVTSVLMFPKVT